MIPQQQQEITLQHFQQNMGGLKRRIAQTQGESNQLMTDATSQALESIMGITTQIFNQMTAKNTRITELRVELEEAYNAHPELKIAKEKKSKK